MMESPRVINKPTGEMLRNRFDDSIANCQILDTNSPSHLIRTGVRDRAVAGHVVARLGPEWSEVNYLMRRVNVNNYQDRNAVFRRWVSAALGIRIASGGT